LEEHSVLQADEVGVDLIKECVKLPFVELAANPINDLGLDVRLQVIDVLSRHVLDVVIVAQQAVHHAPKLAGFFNLLQPTQSVFPRKHHLPPIQLLETSLRVLCPEKILPFYLRLWLLFPLILSLLGMILLELFFELFVDQGHLFKAQLLNIQDVGGHSLFCPKLEHPLLRRHMVEGAAAERLQRQIIIFFQNPF